LSHFGKAQARSLYFHHLDGRATAHEETKLENAMKLLGVGDREALHTFHVDGMKQDRDAEARAAEKLAQALTLFSG
jgi:hypothetical protein